MKKRFLTTTLLILLVAATALLLSCVSPGAGTKSQTKEEEYSGTGRAKGDTFLNARNAAIMDAVRKAVIDEIGGQAEKNNRELLDQNLYNTKNPNAFIFKDTLQNTRKEMVAEGDWIYECTVKVNMEAVRSTLKANGLYGQAESAPDSTGDAKPEETSDESASDDSASDEELTADYGDITDDERAFIARYVDRMTYMVYFADGAKEEELYMRASVGKANEYLASQTMDAIDADQIEKLKADQQTVYEEETGQSISIIQWIAQKLNADIYVEIYGRTSGQTISGKHYGDASIEMKAFEASTAVLLGAASYNTLEKSFSQTSLESARLNAIQGAVYKTIPRLVDLSKAAMEKALVRGIRYEIIIQNPLGDRAMSRFWSRLEDDAKSLKSIAQSADEVKYYVWYIGSVDDLKNLIYDITESIPGLQNMEMVMSRGKSITFNSGS